MQPQLRSNGTEASINNSERKTNKQKKIDNHPHADYTDGQMNVKASHSPASMITHPASFVHPASSP